MICSCSNRISVGKLTRRPCGLTTRGKLTRHGTERAVSRLRKCLSHPNHLDQTSETSQTQEPPVGASPRRQHERPDHPRPHMLQVPSTASQGLAGEGVQQSPPPVPPLSQLYAKYLPPPPPPPPSGSAAMAYPIAQPQPLAPEGFGAGYAYAKPPSHRRGLQRLA